MVQQRGCYLKVAAQDELLHVVEDVMLVGAEACALYAIITIAWVVARVQLPLLVARGCTSPVEAAMTRKREIEAPWRVACAADRITGSTEPHVESGERCWKDWFRWWWQR